jgi:predicted Zn-dependent peptidase
MYGYTTQHEKDFSEEKTMEKNVQTEQMLSEEQLQTITGAGDPSQAEDKAAKFLRVANVYFDKSTHAEMMKIGSSTSQEYRKHEHLQEVYDNLAGLNARAAEKAAGILQIVKK